MSFLDKLVSGLGGAAVGFVTGGPVGAVAGAVAGFASEDEEKSTAVATMKPSNTSLTAASTQAIAETQPGLASKVLSTLAMGPLPLGVVALKERAEIAAAQAGGAVVGGKNRIVTTITTMNAAGQIIRQKNLSGRPFLMNKDIVTAKRVFRTIQKASGRLPRRTVKEGKTKQLTDAVMDKALSNVITDNGNGGKC